MRQLSAMKNICSARKLYVIPLT